MATQNLNFAAAVSDWVRETKARGTAVFRESAQRVITEMQTPIAAGGNMPVRDGFLRASLQVTKDAPMGLTRQKPAEGVTYTYEGSATSLVIAGAELGETLFASYTANYAGHQNYGTSKMQGRQFVGLAAQKWPSIVNAVASEAQSRAGGYSR